MLSRLLNIGRLVVWWEALAVLASNRYEHAAAAGFTEQTRQYVEHVMAHFHVPGLSFAILNGADTYTNALGYAILPDINATPNTLYYTASTTKAFTAISLLSVLERNSSISRGLSLDSRLIDIIGADFAMPEDYGTLHSTLRDVLSHRLGFPACDLSYGGPNFTAQDAVRSLRYLPMVSEFRSDFNYLNLGYMTIQHVIQTLTGKWIGDVHQETIWDPLDMTATSIRLQDALSKSTPEGVLAHGYSWDPLTKSLGQQPWTDTLLVGGGGVISSVNDYAKFLRAMLEKQLSLSSDAQSRLIDPIVLEGGSTPFGNMTDMLYSMGWEISSYRGHNLVMHTGKITGFSAIVAFLPDLDWGTVLFCNGDNNGAQALKAVFLRFLDDFLEIPAELREDVIPAMDIANNKSVVSYRNTRASLYPSLPSPLLPPSLPLSAYEGTYHNPGFRNISFALAKPLETTPVANTTASVLHSVWRRVVNTTIDLEHVSGETFIAWVDTEVPAPLLRVGLPAEFRLGPSGRVTSLGFSADPSLIALDEKVWFEKLD